MRDYFICRPDRTGSLDEEWKGCLDQLVNKQEQGWNLIKLVVFVDSPDLKTYIRDIENIGHSLKNEFSGKCPSFGIVAQGPLTPWKVVVEALATDADQVSCLYKMCDTIPYVTIESGFGKEIWAAGLGNGLRLNDTRAASELAFDQMKSILSAGKMSFDHIVRQWNYVGNILSQRDGYQNYQLFNEVRSEYYDLYRSGKGYPAATGVGTLHGGFFLDFHALQTVGNTVIVPLGNPDQTNAYEYDQNVLVGMRSNGKKGKNPPKFERALLLSSADETILYVSGTASIRGQDTVATDDVAGQTEVTIGNIQKLTDIGRIRMLSGISDLGAPRLVSSRVYIKRKSDFETVRSVCAGTFAPDVSTFVEADICRDDLLVEIEAEYRIGRL